MAKDPASAVNEAAVPEPAAPQVASTSATAPKAGAGRILAAILRWTWRVALVLAGAGLMVLAGLRFAPALLCVESPGTDWDAMVILGGDQTARPARALQIISLKSPPLVVVSGDGDGARIARKMVRSGVPQNKVILEPNSKSTQENAEFSVPILRKHGAKRVVIVTSWFHSRRALACFQHYAPDMVFLSKPTIEDRPRSAWPTKEQRIRVFTEFLKSGYYVVRHGIRPF